MSDTQQNSVNRWLDERITELEKAVIVLKNPSPVYVASHPVASNPVDDHETANVSDKLRDAAKLTREVRWVRDEKDAAAIIEADRQATRAALVAEIVAWLKGEIEEYPAGQYSGFAAMIREEIEAKWGK